MIVLEVLSHDPNVSTWDMDDSKRYPLWKTIKRLEESQYIESVKKHYPWHQFNITELGKKALLEYKDKRIS
jgi:DNA-binding PadR family transcriptional regulator